MVLIDNTKYEAILRKNAQAKDEPENVWVGFVDGFEGDNAYAIKVVHYEQNNEIMITKGAQITNSEIDLREQFIDTLVEIEKSAIEDQLTGFENTNESIEITQEFDPYNPDLIRVDPKPFPLSHIYRLMTSDEDELDISPDFQRNFVWNDITRKSRLIESLLLRIPLPVFYFTQDKEGKYQVVDGVQRLTVIKSYMNNEFKLKNLEYLRECEGRFFKHLKYPSISLDAKYVRRINDTFITVNVIDPQTPQKVKFDIFKRINTGGKTLNAQEIRNCLADVSIRKMLKRLASSPHFVKATDGGISSTRMADQEIALRFIGFYYLNVLKKKGLAYKGDIDQYLDTVLSTLNEEDSGVLSVIEAKFINSMKNANYLFGKHAFRKCFPDHIYGLQKKPLINKSLFVTVSVLLSHYDNDYVVDNFEPMYLALPFASEIECDAKYLDVLTNGTNDVKRLDYSFKVSQKIIERELGKLHDKKIRN
jgi:hypothetical protein